MNPARTAITVAIISSAVLYLRIWKSVRFLRPYLHLIWAVHQTGILMFVVSMFFNVAGVAYILASTVGSRYVGRRLSQLDRELADGSLAVRLGE